jgi:hypothetical protein
MIENWLFQRSLLTKKRSRACGAVSLIVPGVLGGRGDILVDDVNYPKRVFGVCDGEGGLVSKEEGLILLEKYTTEIAEEIITIVYSLYK